MESWNVEIFVSCAESLQRYNPDVKWLKFKKQTLWMGCHWWKVFPMKVASNFVQSVSIHCKSCTIPSDLEWVQRSLEQSNLHVCSKWFSQPQKTWSVLQLLVSGTEQVNLLCTVLLSDSTETILVIYCKFSTIKGCDLTVPSHRGWNDRVLAITTTSWGFLWVHVDLLECGLICYVKSWDHSSPAENVHRA